MKDSSLSAAVERFAQSTLNLTEADLEKPWAWRQYDDGVRHAFFRTYEELRELATTVAAERIVRGVAPTIAHRALAQYHAAFRDLEAVLLGVTDDDGRRRATPEEWPMPWVVAHIMGTERQFFARIRYAVDGVRTGDGRPLEMPEDVFRAFFPGAKWGDDLKEQPLSAVLAHYAALNGRIIAELSDIRDDEQNAPSVWWEEEEMPVRFRFHRFDSHLRQHTVHAEKILVGLNLLPTEAKRLTRLLYGALAEVEGNLIGAPGFAVDRCQELGATIEARLAEILAV